MLEKVKAWVGRKLAAKLGQAVEFQGKTYYPYSSRTGIGSLPSSGLHEGLSHTKALKQSDSLAIAAPLMVDGIMFAEWEVVDGITKAPVPETHPAMKLLRKPNRLMSWEDMVEIYAYHGILGGNGYLVETKMDAMGAPMEIWPFHPSCMRIQKDPIYIVKGYEALIDGKAVPIPVERVHHFRIADPDNPWFGLGIVGRAERLFNNDIAMSEYQGSYFENMAIPGTTVESPGPIGEEERETIRETIDARHAGWWNAFKTLVLPTGVKLTNMQSSPREVDYMQSKEMASKNIGALFRLGRALMGRNDVGSRATVDAELYMFARLGVTPMLKRLTPHFDAIVKKFGPNLKFQYKSVVEADMTSEAAVDAIDFRQAGITPNEIREHRGRKKIMKPGMDEVWLPMGLMTMDDAAAPPLPVPPALAPFAGVNNPPKPGEEKPKPDEKPGEQAADEVAEGEGNKPPKPPVPPAPPKSVKRTYRRAFQTRFHRESMRYKVGEAKRWRSSLASFYEEEAKRLAREYEEGSKGITIEAVMKGDGWIIDHETGIVKLTRRMFVPALERDFTIQAEIIGLSDASSFVPGTHEFSQSLSWLGRDVVGISETTRADLAEVIRQGTEMGLSAHDIATGNPDLDYPGIKGTFDNYASNRAELIARTEASRVWDQAGLRSFDKLGVQECDVVGCEDNEIFEGQEFGCNAQGVPITKAYHVLFHPNHKGTWAPRLEAYRELRYLTHPVEYDSLAIAV